MDGSICYPAPAADPAWNVGLLSDAKQQYVQQLAKGPLEGLAATLNVGVFCYSLCMCFTEGAEPCPLCLVLCEMGRRNHCFVGFTGFRGLTNARRGVRGAGRGEGLGLYVRNDLMGLADMVKRTHHSVWLAAHGFACVWG